MIDQNVLAAIEPWWWTGALLLLGLAATAGCLETRRGRPPRIGFMLSGAACAALVAFGLVLVAGGPSFAASGGTVIGFTPLDVRYDALAGLFVLALGIVGVAASLAGLGGGGHAPANAVTAIAYPTFLGSILLVFGSCDAFAFLLAWEVMALSSAALVIGARPVPEQVAAGSLYLAMTHLATVALVVAFGMLAASANGSIAFAEWTRIGPMLTSPTRDVIFLLFLVGFGTKAGAVPLHVWLPRAHPAAPAHVSAVMSGVMIKAGVFGLIRLGIGVLGPASEGWGIALLLAGGVSAVLGVLYALMEHDLKRLLAFSSVENIGIAFLGLGAAIVLAAHGLAVPAAAALAATLFHSLNHAVFKGLLFVAAGAIQASAGTRNLNRLGGLIRAMPGTALAFGVGAVAIAGLPPLNGFAGEWLTFRGLIDAGAVEQVGVMARTVALAAVGALALTTALAVAAFVKVTGTAFLALPRSPGAAAATEATAPERAAMGGLAVLCVGLGLAASPVAGRLTAIAAPLVGGGSSGAVGDPLTRSLAASALAAGTVAQPVAGSVTLPGLGLLAAAFALVALVAARRGRVREIVRTTPTWTCGIVPEAGMEYTASGYSKLLRLFFRRVLRPQRDLRTRYHAGTPLPQSMQYDGGVTHVLEEQVFRPLHTGSVKGASLLRRLQNGSLQLYLAYALGGLVVLLVLAR